MVTVFISAAGENAVTVPPLTNRPLSDAQQELRSLGLVASVRRRQETNSVRENTVLEQNPEANRKLKPGCPVELTISIRVQMVEVPNYIGLTREEALRRLPRFFGTLNRGRIVEVDSNQFPGTVIDQSPRPGEMVRPGTTVDLVVSKSQRIDRPPPPDEVGVPDLRGMTEQQAESALRRIGLRKGNVTYREGGKLDTVTDQDPKPHLRVPRGTAVNIVIANIG
jgi:serine/threonine-protein kinase